MLSWQMIIRIESPPPPPHFGISFWCGVILSLYIALKSLETLVSAQACNRLMDIVYRKDRDKGEDPARIRRFRLTSLITLIGSLYFIWGLIASGGARP
jgi:hypothetical protein